MSFCTVEGSTLPRETGHVEYSCCDTHAEAHSISSRVSEIGLAVLWMAFCAFCGVCIAYDTLNEISWSMVVYGAVSGMGVGVLTFLVPGIAMVPFAIYIMGHSRPINF